MSGESPRGWSDVDIERIVRGGFMRPVRTEEVSTACEQADARVESNRVSNVATGEQWQAIRIVPPDDAHYVAVIVPVMRDGRLLFVGRYRYAIDRWAIELPRFSSITQDDGWMHPAESQLIQHVGINAKKMTLLGAIHPESSVVASNTVVILAEDCVQRATRPADPRALIAGTVGVSTDELDRRILQGDIACGVSLAALYLYTAHTRHTKHAPG
jgi:hypothetical protein